MTGPEAVFDEKNSEAVLEWFEKNYGPDETRMEIKERDLKRNIVSGRSFHVGSVVICQYIYWLPTSIYAGHTVV